MPHLRAVEDGKDLFTTGVTLSLQPWVALGQAVEMDSWHWVHEWREKGERDRERKTARDHERV